MNTGHLRAVLEHVAREHGLDLGDYRPDVLARRVEARLADTRTDLAQYLALLRRDPAEGRRLADTLLVHVTEPLRDPEVFDALAARVLPALAPGRTLRAWAIGVATGEEAWSLAATLAAVLGERWELLATDRDPACVAAAGGATLDAAALRAAVARLAWPGRAVVAAGFAQDGPRATPTDALRARVRLAVHDLMGLHAAPREAIVASFPLVLCRNVLMYFDARFRDAAGERLHAIVEPAGVLVIGRAESLPSSVEGRFEPFPGLDPRLRIFRRREVPC